MREVARAGISNRRLERVIAHVLRREHAPATSRVNVILTTDTTIRSLNRRFLRRDHPTDVLAFPSGDRRLLGEVAISVDRARVQARVAGHALATEVALLATHGVLHLRGYRDHSATSRSRMMRRQRTLLRELGMVARG